MKTAVLIDFDDVVFNTTRYKILRDEYYKQKFDKKFWKRFKKYEHDYAVGEVKVFNLHDILTDEELAITNQHLKEMAPTLVYDDFAAFIEKIGGNRFAPIILTFGEKELQTTKIAAAGLDLPVIHTDIKNKAELMKGWRSDEGYRVGELDFGEVVLIDDRQGNFIGFEQLPNARGFLMQRTAGLAYNLPKNVSIVGGFKEIDLAEGRE